MLAKSLVSGYNGGQKREARVQDVPELSIIAVRTTDRETECQLFPDQAQ